MVGWQALAVDYVRGVLEGGRWPADDDYDGGDFDSYNERLRDSWRGVAPADVRERADRIHDDLLGLVRRLPLEVIRGDAAWGWAYMVLHGHALDHLGIVEPWADRLRERQASGDPFGPDPRIGSGDAAADRAAFHADRAAIFGLFEQMIGTVRLPGWTEGELTPGWSLRDHVGHLADWLDEGADAVAVFLRTGSWPDGPEEGIDAWNARAAERGRGRDPEATLERFRVGRARLEEAVESLDEGDLRSPEGWSWVYECLHGHVRAHLAMIGPWCARVAWPGGL